jgi:large subunit ribosomal protein L30
MAKTITQIRSAVGTSKRHRGTLRALGLRGIGHHRTHEDSPTLRGMLLQVDHLVRIDESPTTDPAEAR